MVDGGKGRVRLDSVGLGHGWGERVGGRVWGEHQWITPIKLGIELRAKRGARMNLRKIRCGFVFKIRGAGRSLLRVSGLAKPVFVCLPGLSRRHP